MPTRRMVSQTWQATCRIADSIILPATFKCSRHSATDYLFFAGFQMNCSTERSTTNCRVCSFSDEKSLQKS